MTGKQDICIFLGGDVMTGRGIDQILPHPNPPELHQDNGYNAQTYVELAKRCNGDIEMPVSLEYIWGEALEVFDCYQPDLKLINLETSITTCDDWWPDKGINYRMHPGNIDCLKAAGFDCCCLANNHIMDWGYGGLAETIEVLEKHDIGFTGAGRDIEHAMEPAAFTIPGKGRILVFSYGTNSSGVPRAWAADQGRPGINMLSDLSEQSLEEIVAQIQKYREPDDIVIFSVHWGVNWNYYVHPHYIDFAHKLIDVAGIDIVCSHSSHHPKPIEVYKGKLIMYGCGDLINDYEGIVSARKKRGDLGLMYFLTIESQTKRIMALEMVPMKIRRLSLTKAPRSDALWLRKRLLSGTKDHRPHIIPLVWLRDKFTRKHVRIRTNVDIKNDNSITLKLT